VPHVIDAIVKKNKFRHVLLNEFEVLVAAQVIDVLHIAGHKVVDANHFMPTCDQQIGKVRAEKTRGAGDHGRGLAGFSFFHRAGVRQLLNRRHHFLFSLSSCHGRDSSVSQGKLPTAEKRTQIMAGTDAPSGA
jgi:hypothetical protein